MTPDEGPVVLVPPAVGRPALERLRLAVAEHALRARVAGLVVMRAAEGPVDGDASGLAVAGLALHEIDAELLDRRRQVLRGLGWLPEDEYRVGGRGVRLDEGDPAARSGPPWLLPDVVDGVDVAATLTGAAGVDDEELAAALAAESETVVIEGFVADLWLAAVRRWHVDGSLTGRSVARLEADERLVATSAGAERRAAAAREALAERIVAHEHTLAERAGGPPARSWRPWRRSR